MNRSGPHPQALHSLSHRNHVHVALTWGFITCRRSVSARKRAETTSEINLLWHVAKAGFSGIRQSCCSVGQAGESARIGGHWLAEVRLDVMGKEVACGSNVSSRGVGLLLGLVAARCTDAAAGLPVGSAVGRLGGHWLAEVRLGCHEEGGEQVQPGSRKVPAGSQAVFRQHSGYVRLKGPKTPGVSFFAYPNGYASCPTPARDRASKTGVSTDLLKETPQRVFAGLYISGVLSRYFGGYMDTNGLETSKTPGQRDFSAYPFAYPPCIPFRKMDTPGACRRLQVGSTPALHL